MGNGIKTAKLHIGGMTCVSCQNKIERQLRSTAGVERAAVSYSAGTAVVTYDTDILSFRQLNAVIERLGYTVLAGQRRSPADRRRAAEFLLLIAALYWLLQRLGILNLLAPGRLADTRMGYGMLFVIGLVTSVHCVAMCGGINLSQCIPRGGERAGAQRGVSAFAPALLYNLGRVISYTAIGFVLGLTGMLLGGGGGAGLPVPLQGALKLAAGVLMVIMGINMLGLFPWLRRFTPRMPRVFARRVNAGKAGSGGPLLVGLLNGLMPCGPLQSMQIVALASGNPLAGALSMLLFSLGTVPLMLGLGSIVSALGQRFAAKVMTVGAVLVVVLGLAMLSQGWSLSGLPAHPMLGGGRSQGTDAGGSHVKVVDGVQVVSSTLAPGRYPDITVREGIPVRWVIDAPKGSVNGCNNRMFIQEYGIEHSFKTGENIIEFIPEKAGAVRYSCWMGMIRGSISITPGGVSSPAAATDSIGGI